MTPEYVYLNPGQWHADAYRTSVVETILGSCVGIVLRDAAGATCVGHCMLPYARHDEPRGEPGRFVDLCLNEMFGFFERRGKPRRELEAKLFGGARVLPPYRSDTRGIGEENIAAAVAILKRMDVCLVACDVGGGRGRRIVVNTADGSVFVRELGCRAQDPHETREGSGR